MLNVGIRVFKALFLAALTVASIRAGEITIPNHSFEQPPVDPEAGVSPGHVSWQQTPKPADFQEFPEFNVFWFTLTGVFLNTAPTSTADHIDNMDGNQAAYLFSDSRNGIFQELTAQFEAGFSYKMTAAITGSPNRPLPNGTRLGLTVYYRNAESAIVPIATTPVAYGPEFSGTHLREFTVTAPATHGDAAWIGKKIGVLIQALDSADGVWDIDNVRLESVREFIDIPNFSFELPPVDPQAGVSPGHVSWQQTPKPDDFQEFPEFNVFWFTLTGVFSNPASPSPDRIDNMDGNQAAYLFAESRNGIFQDLAAVYEAGFSYKVTAAITGSPNRPLPNGAQLGLTLYYRDAVNQMTPIAMTPVSFNSAEFTGSHLRDFTVSIRSSRNAAWIGKPIGILIKPLDTVDGVWDVENVRLTSFREMMEIPNFSFEQPPVDPQAGVSPGHVSWQQTPKPDDFQEFPEFNIYWFTLTGAFLNTPPTSTADHIDNLEGNQAAYLFADSRNGIYQDLASAYQPSVAYILTAGITSSPNRPLPNGSTLDLTLYYRDLPTSAMKPIKTTTVTYNPANFTGTHLGDFSVTVQPEGSMPWIGKPIGVFIKASSTADGVWDIDNVRLTALPVPRLRFSTVNGDLIVKWDSEINLGYRFRFSSDLVTWQNEGLVGNGTGGESTRNLTGQGAPGSELPQPGFPYKFFGLEVFYPTP